MAGRKQKLNAKEQKYAEAILAEHARLVTAIDYDAEAGAFVVNGTSDEQYTSEDDETLEDLIARVLDDENELLEQRIADGSETDNDEEDAEERAGSIVPAKYRTEYKARGDATRCSDEFCERIDPFVCLPYNGKSGKAKTKMVGDLEKTYALARANGIAKRWDNLNKGQQCMNARNMVRNLAVKTGYVNVPAELAGEAKRIEFSAEWLDAHRKEDKIAA